MISRFEKIEAKMKTFTKGLIHTKNVHMVYCRKSNTCIIGIQEKSQWKESGRINVCQQNGQECSKIDGTRQTIDLSSSKIQSRKNIKKSTHRKIIRIL